MFEELVQELRGDWSVKLPVCSLVEEENQDLLIFAGALLLKAAERDQ